MPRAKQRTPELAAQILDAAVDLLAREGVTGLTARSVAAEARTSAPAIYELYGDRAGLVRAVFLEGFRRLSGELAAVPDTDDPRADILALISRFRAFSQANPVLTEVMFSRPFADYDPDAEDVAAGAVVAGSIVHQVKRARAAGLIAGDAREVALIIATVAQGLAAAENARRFGSDRPTLDRRWELTIEALLDGFAPRA